MQSLTEMPEGQRMSCAGEDSMEIGDLFLLFCNIRLLALQYLQKVSMGSTAFPCNQTAVRQKGSLPSHLPKACTSLFQMDDP